MGPLEKLQTYFRARRVLGGINLEGLPVLPKSVARSAAFNRGAFNEFVLWMDRLQLPEVRWVVDVGANHGDFSAAATALFPQAKVLLLEPQPALQEILRARGARYGGRWQVEGSAAGSAETELTLHISEEQDAVGSLLGFSEAYRKMNADLGQVREIRCPVRRLDDVARQYGIAQIDLLKIDVEGFEFEALAGATELLPRTQAVVVEVSLVRKEEHRKHPLAEMLSLLLGYGFSLVAAIPSVYAPARPWQPLEFNLLLRR